MYGPISPRPILASSLRPRRSSFTASCRLRPRSRCGSPANTPIPGSAPPPPAWGIISSSNLGQCFAEPDRLASRLAKLTLPHGEPAAHDSANRPALHLAPGKRRPAAFAADPRIFDDALCLEIDHG